jgi:hypothetical protein
LRKSQRWMETIEVMKVDELSMRKEKDVPGEIGEENMKLKLGPLGQAGSRVDGPSSADWT